MTILPWLIYIFCILLTIVFGYNLRCKAQKEQHTESIFETQAFLMFISVLSIVIFNISPFHLLWVFLILLVCPLLCMLLSPLWPLARWYAKIWYIGLIRKD